MILKERLWTPLLSSFVKLFFPFSIVFPNLGDALWKEAEDNCLSYNKGK